MDLRKELLEQTIGNYKIVKYINCGKSADVYEAVDSEGNKVALKLFNADLVNKYGHELQEDRIALELTLKAHTIPSLIKILDGGKHVYNGTLYHFVVMEYVDGKNLKEFIETENYDEDFIKKAVKSLLESTEALIINGLAHRDIKPENIMVSKKNDIILMDLGVLKSINHVKTDNEATERQFLATLRYAPPELLFREEKDNIDGWRAINFYQIGGVLHDLIMKKELFQGVSPYGSLVKAIEHEAPEINSKIYSSNLISLTRTLLVKKPDARLKLTTTEDIKNYCGGIQEKGTLAEELQKNKTINSSHQSTLEEINRHKKTKEELSKKRYDLLKQLKEMVLRCLKSLQVNQMFTDFALGSDFSYQSDLTSETRLSNAIINIPIIVYQDLGYSFPNNFYFSLGLRIDAEGIYSIDTVAFYGGHSVRWDNTNFQTTVLQALNPYQNITNSGAQAFQRNRPELNTSPPHIHLLDGLFSDDSITQEKILIKLAQLINKAKELGKDETEAQLQINKEIVLGTRTSSITTGLKINFLDSL